MAVVTGTNSYERLPRLNLELRHVEESKLRMLSTIIDVDKAWGCLLEKLTSQDPSTTKDCSHLNLSLNTINLIKQQATCGESPSRALLNHWAITGRRRPTIKVLLDHLNECQLKRAADYVCRSILGIEPIESSQPVRLQPRLETYIATYKIDDIFKFNNISEIIADLSFKPAKYSFRSLYDRTDGFSDAPYDVLNRHGFKIGEGRFSSVYRTMEFPSDNESGQTNEVVAVKLLKTICNTYLANEINLMGKIRHKNILELLSVTWDTMPSCSTSEGYICLVYPYMENGTLRDCLDLGLATRNRTHLNSFERIVMVKKIADGIAFFHHFPDGPIVHRDIKTANIFLGIDLEPKLGDFTLVRQLDQDRLATTQFTQNISGTSAYMPPEAFRNGFSVKFDIFSFGVVLLEILTGLRPFLPEYEEDLFTHLNDRLSDIKEENSTDEARDRELDKFVNDILDKKAGDWNFESAKMLFKIAFQATESRRQSRPEISAILPVLETVEAQSRA